MSPPARPDPGAVAETARTLLFVPGDRPERFSRAAAAGADAIVLDLEDAVAPHHKDAARGHVASWLADPPAASAVRINPVGSAWHDADLGALSASGPVLVMLPKAESPEAVVDLLGALPDGSSVIALVETARGVHRAADLAQVPGVARLALGTYDLAAELGVDPDHGPAFSGIRTMLVLASALARLSPPVDGVTGDVHDIDRVSTDTAVARALGFGGKLCIHPAQVAPALAALAPTAAEIDWAERVLTAAAAANDGVLRVDGRMVDAPVVARAARIRAAARGSTGGP